METRESVRRLFNIWQDINIMYENCARGQGLSAPQLYILESLKEEGECTQKQLCSLLLLPKQTVNSLVGGFARSGLVELIRDQRDRRRRFIILTAAGRAYAERVLAPFKRAELRAMAGLSAAEREYVIGKLEKYVGSMRAELQPAGAASPPRAAKAAG